jgi:hypothetical protein
MKKLLLILLTLNVSVFAQVWDFEEGGNSFDGKYKTASIRGIGSNYPYDNPFLVINKFDNDANFNFYISDAGYFREDQGLKILWVIDSKSDTLYKSYDWSYSTDNKTLFFKEFIDPKGESEYLRYDKYFYLQKIEFVQKLKNASKLEVRITNDFGKNDIVFSLKGSKKAIEFVLDSVYTKNIHQQLSSTRKELFIEKETWEASIDTIKTHLSEYEINNEFIDDIISRIKYDSRPSNLDGFDLNEYNFLKITTNTASFFKVILYGKDSSVLYEDLYRKIPDVNLKLLKKINRNKDLY